MPAASHLQYSRSPTRHCKEYSPCRTLMQKQPRSRRALERSRTQRCAINPRQPTCGLPKKLALCLVRNTALVKYCENMYSGTYHTSIEESSVLCFAPSTEGSSVAGMSPRYAKVPV